jgi:predicted metal-binding membrane protein
MQGGMPMPGGWTMSMMWMAMPGQSTAGAAWMFLLMWQAMMIAMMLPSAWPMLEMYRRVAISSSMPHPGLATALVACAYFGVWLAFGMVAFAIGFGISSASMHSLTISKVVPTAGGVALIVSGAYQLSPLKQTCLRHCRSAMSYLVHGWRPGWAGAIRLGLSHGSHCALCCWALMTIQVVLGAMNLIVMIVVAAVIGFEKLWKHGPMLARASGVVAVAAGVWLLVAPYFNT